MHLCAQSLKAMMWMQPGSEVISHLSDTCTSQLGPAAGFRLLESSCLTETLAGSGLGLQQGSCTSLNTLQTLSFFRFLFTQMKIYITDILHLPGCSETKYLKSWIYSCHGAQTVDGTDECHKECPEVGMQISLMCGVVLFHSHEEGRRDCCPQSESSSPA